MADYIYLLENRLSADQRNALRQLREAAREAGIILFLTGDAVRDLTSGHAVRDLEVSVHGNAIKLKKVIEKLGGVVWGESEFSHTLYLCFPGTVRVDLVSTHRLDYAKITKPVYHTASIQEDLRRRDFTVNAMAISLNEGSFGLLMDPLNGAADIEARTLRLVSNYGFLEEPSLLIRATRYIARLGWELDPKTQTRYENAKGEGGIEQMSAEARSRELEQIGHEDDGLKVLRALEDEGWMKVLFPAWTHAKADEEKLKALHDLAVELQVQGVHPDMSAAQMQLLTAKLSPKDLAALKKDLLRPGFVGEWNSLDAIAAKFAKVLLSKENFTASAGFKLFTSYDPEAILWLGFTSKDKAVQERYTQFLKVWPEARQKTPHALMQEMRITPELATYKDIVQALFLELIDGKLTTPEELRAFLEPHSPPAPPPQVTVKRPRAKRGEAKVKERSYDDDEESEDALDDDEDLDDLGADDEEIDLGIAIPKEDLDPDHVEEADAAEDDGEDEPEPAPAKRGAKGAAGRPDAKAKTEDRSASASKSGAARLNAPSVIQKAQASGNKSAAVPAAVPAKPTGPGADKAGKAAAIRKEDQMASKTVIAPASVKPGTGPVKNIPGVKPPQVVSAAAMARPVSISAPGVKPPQGISSLAVTAQPAQSIGRISGVKPPQPIKAQALAAKPAKGKNVPGVKPPQVGAKPKAVVVKALAAKGKPVAKAAAKPAAKPAKKVAAPAKKAPAKKAPAKKVAAKKPAPKKAGKKR
jgi:tRNA nucleotidyltransferase (CCA-adding enzyme)